MNFIETPLVGAYVIEVEPAKDSRGLFARTLDADTFRAKGLQPTFVQCNTSFNKYRGTLRGMHFQVAPHAETKLVRCTHGSIYDVIVDLREDSATYREWFGVELESRDRKMLYVPEGFAHGFQTLRDDCEVFYQMGSPYCAEASRGVRWDDPAIGIRWPVPAKHLSPKDRTLPYLD